MSTSPISSTSTPAVSPKTTTAQTAPSAPSAKKLKLAQAKLQTDMANKADDATLKADRAAVAKIQAIATNARKGTTTNTYA